MFRHLGVRITLLIVISGPLIFFVFMNLAYAGGRLFGDSTAQNVVWVSLAVLLTPLAMGFAASRYVNRPLRTFIAAIDTLRNQDYRTRIAPTGIAEFDQVAHTFDELAERLAREETLRKNLISDTSHELNTPLAAMTAQLTAMEEGVLPVTKERITGLREQAGRLTELVEALDEYTSARSSEGTMPTEPVRLAAVCHTLERRLAAYFAERRMELVIAVPPSYAVSARDGVLERILANLFQNALRYSAGTAITVTATGEGFSVADDGQGVSPEHIPYLFERFYRVEPSRNRATGGLGLGLAIVRELAEQQGWRVSAHDAEPGLRVHFQTP